LDEHVYPTYSDFADSVVKEKIPSSGLYWDLFGVLVNMRPKGQSGKERADEQHSAERIKTTTLENNLLAAMSHSHPACLYATGGVGVPVDFEGGFGACSSYSQWISGVESLKKTLNKQMKDFTAGVLGNVDINAGGALVAKALMADVKAQWYEVVTALGLSPGAQQGPEDQLNGPSHSPRVDDRKSHPQPTPRQHKVRHRLSVIPKLGIRSGRVGSRSTMGPGSRP
jgi:hypothetical protein